MVGTSAEPLIMARACGKGNVDDGS